MMADDTQFIGTPKKATTHVNQNEGLIFEKSSEGKKAYRLAELDVPAIDAASLLGASVRGGLGVMPELSEIEIIRHFTRLSTWNYAIDLGMYPLGCCTMKYNPRVNEAVARSRASPTRTPTSPSRWRRVASASSKLLQRCLIEITGMDAITLQPAAGAHGEFTGILLVRAWHESQGQRRARRSSSPTRRTAPTPPPPPSAAIRSRTSSRTPRAASTSRHSPARWTRKPPR